MTIRIVLADDQPLVRSGIAMLLAVEADFDVVAEVGNGEDAVQAAAVLNPDVVVLDIRMPVVDGVEATRRIVSARSAATGCPAVLVLTTFNLDAALYASLHAGAAGFLLKDAAPEELVHAIRAVAAGRGWLDPTVTRSVIEQFASRPLGVAVQDSRLESLTPREREVLICVARGMNNAEIARALFLGEGTVKTHISHVLGKLDLRDRVQAVVFAYEANLVPG